MSYEVKKDEMVGKHVAEFQAELTLAKQLEGFDQRPPMPYGYPTSLYHPYHVVMRPKHTEYEHHDHGKMSNDVPWAVSMEVVDDNVVGVYNPHIDQDDKDKD